MNITKKNVFLDTLKAELGIARDAGLREVMGVDYSAISLIRHGFRHPTDNMILSIHETTGKPIADIKALIAASM